MKRISNSTDWLLMENKIRDGRYGPVFLIMKKDTAEMVTAEQLDLEEPFSPALLESVISQLEKKVMNQSEPNVVSYLGYQKKDDRIFLLSENLPGGTLQEFIQKHGIAPQSLARRILHQIALGLAQLSFTVALLNSSNILMDHTGNVKIEALLLDVIVGQQHRIPAVSTVPEIILGQRIMQKADVWLFGIVAAQLLSGDYNIVAATSTRDVETLIKDNQESAWELFVPREISNKLDGRASDLLRRCFSM